MKTIVPTVETIVLADQMVTASKGPKSGADVALEYLPHCPPGQELALVGAILNHAQQAAEADPPPPAECDCLTNISVPPTDVPRVYWRAIDVPKTCWQAVGISAHVHRVTDLQALRGNRLIDCQARRVAMAAIWLLGGSYSEIGKFFERDHSTVITAVKKVSNDPAADNQAKQIVAMLRAQTSTETMDG